MEPLLQGAGGMFVYDAACLRVMREVADEHGLVLVFDEIATGFGRTGTFFAAEAAGVVPDIMCVGKALTGGYLSLAAVLCTGEVARGLSASESGVLMHGPTYMGNPLACSVALASLDLLESSGWSANVARVGAGLSAGLQPLRGLPGVADVRTIGAVGVVQLDHPVDVVKATEAAVEEGVWLRPFRDLVYAMPPYVTSDEDVARICAAIERAVLVGMTRWEDWLAPSRPHATRPGCSGRCDRGRRRARPPTWPGNDYLGLSRDPAVVEAAAAAARRWGAGAGASRLVTGTLELHAQLERELAAYLGQPAALVFSTGYHANLAAVAALGGRDALVVSDAHVHASLVDAVRLSKADVEIVPHHDVAAVGAALAAAGDTRALVLVESVYSVLGDEAPLVGAGGGVRAVRRAAGRRRGARSGGPRAGAGPRARPGRAAARAGHRDPVEGAGQPGRGGAGPAGGRRPSGEPGPPVRLRHRTRARVGRRCAGGAAAAPGPARALRRRTPADGRPRCRARRRAGRGGSAVGADALAAGRARRTGDRPGAGRDRRLLPATVGARRDLPAADHRQRGHPGGRLGPRGGRPRGGGQGARVKVLVVTGTSTGVGKTVATAALAATATGSVLVVKPVQTGALDGDSDAREVARLTGVEAEEWTTLDEPLAPDTAARRQGVDVPAVASYAARIAGSRRTR